MTPKDNGEIVYEVTMLLAVISKYVLIEPPLQMISDIDCVVKLIQVILREIGPN
jgi:hypothetical protein